MTSVLNFFRKKFHHRVLALSAEQTSSRTSRTSRTTASAEVASSSMRNNSGPITRNITNLIPGECIDQWQVVAFIGEGSFGCVYKVTKDGKKYYALKFDYGRDKDDGDVLEIEKHVLVMGMKAENKHMCEFVDSGKCFDCSYIVMTLVGRSLQDLVRGRRDRKLSGGCAISVGRQCLEAIEELHRIGFIHRDIKPSNYATGLKELHAQRKIYLLDFGFCYQYVDSNDKIKHVKKKVAFKGTARYAPLASHFSRPPGRRDDLESWMYQQTEFSKGTLPWRDLEDVDQIGDSKEKARSKDGMRHLLRGCPRYYLDIFKYIINLKQDSTPDYDYLFKILRKTLFESGQPEYPYDWEKQRSSFRGRY